MKKKIAIMSLCIFWIFGTSFAVAGNAYFSANLGAVWLLDSDLSQTDGTEGSAEYDTGFGIVGALGYDFGKFRIEGELGYRENGYDKIGASGQTKADSSGDVNSWSLMTNGYFDIETESPFTPYVGGGIGMARTESSNLDAGGITAQSDDDTVFAYQLIAGAAYSLNEMWMLQLEYRFFGTENPKYRDTESEYMSHNFFLGVRLNF